MLYYEHIVNEDFKAGIRNEVGKSSSALIRQANKFLGQANLYLNLERGLSSVIGSGLSFWNVAR